MNTNSIGSIAMLAAGALAGSAHADTFNFDTHTAGTLPLGWEQGVTGRGGATGSVQPDESAPSKPNVLRQSGIGSFPWVVRRGVSIGDGYVEVRFKALEGRHIKVALNGKTYIELDDAHLAGPGAVGMWTKADSVTAFDDFAFGSGK